MIANKCPFCSRKINFITLNKHTDNFIAVQCPVCKNKWKERIK